MRSRAGRDVLARAWSWTREQIAFLIVAVGVAAGFGYLLVEPAHWRRGTGVISMALLVGAVLRMFVRPSRAGMLAVRGKLVDTLAYILLGGVILAVDIRLHG